MSGIWHYALITDALPLLLAQVSLHACNTASSTPSSGWYLAQRDALLTSRFTQRHLLHYPMVGKISNILWRVGRLYTNAMLESNCSRLHVQ